MELPKAYEAREYEDEIYRRSEASGFFNPDNLRTAPKSEPFSIVMPPPNVTGTLHVGHAVMLVIEDIMIRFARMRGRPTLWVPGTDHAAIATQTVVEKKLLQEGVKDPRRSLGREKFLAEVEKFVAASHSRIVTQIKKMGASCDWSREAYTMDEPRTRAVRTAFKMLYDKGLIYRGDRIVNWCPWCKSTLADDEVEYKEQKSPFYYFKYGPVIIGTARPETKFLDKTIVVNPDDKRYKKLHGQEMEVEWIDGKVKANVIADPVVDPEFGTGAMTITPAHSFEDFDLAQKHGLPIVKIIDEDGNFTAAAGTFAGRNARKSRDEIVEILRKKGLVERIDEDYIHNLSVCYRCDTPVEPLPKLQWFIAVNKQFNFEQSKHAPVKGLRAGQKITLKQLMRHVVESGQVQIVPERFVKNYYHWIDNLRDWCISRQIWFGHRIPVWYRGDEIYVGDAAPSAEGWRQDEDTLDTWFSSGLWTFSALGWPEDTEDFRTFHPTSVLETGYDILFFWIARMILMSGALVGEVPFHTIYLHGLVRDEEGRKMSKSLGNTIDPLDMTEKYGADATRLALVLGTSPGNDVKLSEQKIAGYRNFTNKLWNIARFVFKEIGEETGTERIAGDGSTLADAWILGELDEVTRRITGNLEKYELSQAGEFLRDFTWGSFADWYLEISKLQMADAKLAESTRTVLRRCLRRLLVLWHPFMPFVTEVLWEKFGEGSLLMICEWPQSENMRVRDMALEENFDIVRKIVSAIRNIRAEYGVEAAKTVSVRLAAGDSAGWLSEQSEVIKGLAKVGDLEIAEKFQRPEHSAAAVVGAIVVYVPLSGMIDVEKEKSRLAKSLDEARGYADGLRKKLAGDFVSRAPKEVVEAERAKLVLIESKISKLEFQLKSLIQ